MTDKKKKEADKDKKDDEKRDEGEVGHTPTNPATNPAVPKLREEGESDD